jgi:bacteriorhodopsin
LELSAITGFVRPEDRQITAVRIIITVGMGIAFWSMARAERTGFIEFRSPVLDDNTDFFRRVSF